MKQTVIEIVEKYLRENGHDGLCNDDCHCECKIDNLAPCRADFSACEAGVKTDKKTDKKPDIKTILINLAKIQLEILKGDEK